MINVIEKLVSQEIALNREQQYIINHASKCKAITCNSLKTIAFNKGLNL